MAFDCVEKRIRTLFFIYGGFIAKHPVPFLVLPLFVAVAMGLGMMFFHRLRPEDLEYLFTPSNGQAKTERSTVQNIFSEIRDNDTLVSRLPGRIRFGNVLILRTDGGNILVETVMGDILELHEEIMNIRVQHNTNEFTFQDLCVEYNGFCQENAILAVYGYNTSRIETTRLTYPLHVADDSTVYFLGTGLGGVTVKAGSSTGDVVSAEAVKLSYSLRYQNDADDELSALWENEFEKVVEGFTSLATGIPTLRRTREVSRSYENELGKTGSKVLADFAITFIVLITFSISSCVMFDWVRSKPILGCCGVFSTGLALLSTFGLTSYIGVPYINLAGLSLFLILGIGVDDMFIMVAAWRKTDVTWSVEQRMRHAFSDAALSITITSLTDAIAFGIGTITIFPAARIFCVYAGVSVLFTYAYQITFFAACMVLTGRREAANRHCITFRQVKPRNQSMSRTHILAGAGGYSSSTSSHLVTDEVGRVISNDHVIMLFFKNYYGPFIVRWWMLIITVMLYICYLATAIYGCTQLREGLDLRNLALDNSYVTEYLDDESTYFTKYDALVSLVFTEERDVWTSTVQDRMEETLRMMEESEYTHGREENLTQSWLRDYLDFLQSINLDKPTQSEFMTVLREHFLTVPNFAKYSLDIVFSEDYTSIKASRMFVASTALNGPDPSRGILVEMRQIAESSDLPAIVYNPLFIYFDQYIAVLPNTLQNIAVGMGTMFLLALLMIPNPICSVIVTLSLASIVSGVIGFMALWQVNLDGISMTHIIISVGFSVDFSAHISYAYVASNRGSRRDNLIDALYSIGMPIVQGALSTILGLVVLAFSDAYIFRTFFKTMFLVITLGAIHGLLIIPAFCVLLVPVKTRKIDPHAKSVSSSLTKSALTSTNRPRAGSHPFVISGSRAVVQYRSDAADKHGPAKRGALGVQMSVSPGRSWGPEN